MSVASVEPGSAHVYVVVTCENNSASEIDTTNAIGSVCQRTRHWQSDAAIE